MKIASAASLSALSVAAVFASVGFQATASAAGNEVVSVTEETPPLSAAHAQRLSDLTVHALRKVEDAEQALSSSKPAMAKGDLYKATWVLETVRAELPTVIVRDNLWKASKKAENGKSVDIQPDLMPILTQLDAMEEFVPAKKAKAKVASAAEKAKGGQNKAAAGDLRDAMNILEADQVDVKMKELQRAIDQAIALIDEKKPKDALAELQHAKYLEIESATLFGVPAPAKAGH